MKKEKESNIKSKEGGWKEIKDKKKGKKEKEKNPEIIIKVKLTLENSSKLDKLSKMVEFF